jgi:hypothetical protein
MKPKASIIPGPFALVTSGNCTTSYMLDGDDIQERANAAMNRYWGDTAQVHKRGIPGWGILIDGHHYVVSVYTTREAAESHLQSSEASHDE